MKKQSSHKVPPPSEERALAESDPVDPSETITARLPSALDPSEITLVLPESDAAPVNPEPEVSTMAIRIKDLNQAKTADIPPALLPGSTPEAAPIPIKPEQAQAVLISPQTSSAPSSGRSMKLWLGLVACMLMAGGVIAYWLLRPMPNVDSTLQTPTQTTPEVVPPALRSYLDQAKGGNAKAMHMIALMYWNGLNVRQDRVKGLDWYRKASAAGDIAAQKELRVIEGK